MEGILIILVIGWLIWMLLRYPLKSLKWILKLGFLFVLGSGAIVGTLYLMMVG